jgi:hypothetical protein
MGFSVKQRQELRGNLDRRHVRTREVNGRELSYIGGWYAISEANRIFGFDNWNRETVESRCVLARENRGTYLAVYIARVRITVNVGGAVIVREGHGTGEGRSSSPGEVHDTALKGAETDATKRALATFGNPFGLSLYEHGKLPSPEKATPIANAKIAEPKVLETSKPSFARDDTTPIPRPSTYHGREQYLATRELPPHNLLAKPTPQPQPAPSANVSIVPAAEDLIPGRIDKSVLTIGEPKRRRDKAHLRFVATQPCLVCGRQPSDPHHLRFAQPRALGLKVSDEFTVPLCRGHHRLLHQAGNEVAWWEDLDIDALEIAKGLWDETHGRHTSAERSGPTESPSASSVTAKS